ncbi:MAG: peptidylprolyl isomerase [Terrimicrobiaceae bacterium]|nr:peptidylprolyl isomerase [Terrimicrobiaceae bacterium]
MLSLFPKAGCRARMLLGAACFALAFACPAVAGTKVRIATQIGNIDLELYDADKPITVRNFLRYVNEGRYAGTFLHRLEPGFVIQGGGYKLDASKTPVHIEKLPPIQNEYAVGPTVSNTIGTIAMAKVAPFDNGGNPIPGGGPDSATSEWFINLGNNSANLDVQNGGFTVFGRVIAGLDLLNRFNTTFLDANTDADVIVNSSFGFPTLPVLAFTNGQFLFKDLLWTTITVLHDAPLVAPYIRIRGAAKVQTSQPAVQIAGAASSSVVRIEWRVGGKGGMRHKPAAISWKVRVTGLKPGTNLIYARGVTTTGVGSAYQKIKVVRK